MTIVGIKTIGFVEQNEVDDQWSIEHIDPDQPDDRAVPVETTILGYKGFRSIDQRQASMTEELTMDENGSHYRQQVQFTVRTEYDRDLARKYERRPLVLHVWTVDGHHYKIGTKSYPAYIVPAKTNSMDTVETALTVEYDTLTPVM